MSRNKIQDRMIGFVDWISRYSLAYYIGITIMLFIIQLDIFKDNVPKEYITDGIITLLVFTIGSNVLDKILKRKNKHEPKPFLYCPECPDAKMRTTGKWVCESCNQEFGEPRKENNSSP